MLDAIADWAYKSLLKQGYQVISSLEDVQITPWSSVKRLLTDNGTIYLKQTPDLLSLEPTVIQLLKHKFQAAVPEVIAVDKELQCFLMKEGGKQFYHYNKTKDRLELICKAINKYKQIQNHSSECINDFLELKVPDWRLNKIPLLYTQLISQKNVLLKDGMPVIDIQKLPEFSAQCASLCNDLSKFAMPVTLDHCDLHGGNILVNEKTHEITIIDWGETVITHPFFSLSAFLRSLVKYYQFTESELWDVCFKNENYMEKYILQKIVTLAQSLEPIYSALAFYRLLLSSDEEKFMAAPNCKGRITAYLQEFMNKAISFCK